jgi:hypothetical protein
MIKRLLFLFMFLFSHTAVSAGVTELRLSTAQIFDVQWNISGGKLNASGFNYIYSSVNYATQTTSAARWTSAQTADAGANGRYISFFNSTTNLGTYGMAVYNSDGTVYKIINNTGSFRALADGAIFYNGNSMWGTLITTGQGYNLGQSGSWTITQEYPSNAQLQAYTPPSSTPLAPGETATTTPPSSPNTTTVGISSGLTQSQYTRATTVYNRRANDNNIYIDQIGDNNTISVTQSSSNNTLIGVDNARAQLMGNSNTVDVKQGSPGAPGRNLVELNYNGNNNNITIYQDRNANGTATTNGYGDHVARADVTGDANTLSIVQQNAITSPQQHWAEVVVDGTANNVSALQLSGGSKTAFINIQGDSNVVDLQQTDTPKYADINLIGNGHDVTIDQRGTGQHWATIELTNNGAASTVDLTQQGSTQQSYSLQQTCVALPCGVTVVQGQ